MTKRIKYVFHRYLTSIPIGTQRELFQRACDVWSAVADVAFERTDQWTDADATVSTGPRRGRNGRVVGRCSGGRRGRIAVIRFDDGVQWATGPDERGIDYVSVACHEIGHLLGVKHSPDPNSVMHRFYRNSTSLQESDILRARTLYGPARTDNG